MVELVGSRPDVGYLVAAANAEPRLQSIANLAAPRQPQVSVIYRIACLNASEYQHMAQVLREFQEGVHEVAVGSCEQCPLTSLCKPVFGFNQLRDANNGHGCVAFQTVVHEHERRSLTELRLLDQ